MIAEYRIPVANGSAEATHKELSIIVRKPNKILSHDVSEDGTWLIWNLECSPRGYIQIGKMLAGWHKIMYLGIKKQLTIPLIKNKLKESDLKEAEHFLSQDLEHKVISISSDEEEEKIKKPFWQKIFKNKHQ